VSLGAGEALASVFLWWLFGVLSGGDAVEWLVWRGVIGGGSVLAALAYATIPRPIGA